MSSSFTLSTRGDVVHQGDCRRKGRSAPWVYARGKTLDEVLELIRQAPALRACSLCMVPGGDLDDQLELGVALRDQGVADADNSADEKWRADVDGAIRRLAARGEPFTADDVRALGVPDPASPKAWGGRFLAAAGAGVIERIGDRKSARPSVRAHRISVWQAKEAS
jgi:hypothetical protein